MSYLKFEIVSGCSSTVWCSRLVYYWSAACPGNFGRSAFTLRPLAHNLYDLSDIGTFTFRVTGVERRSVDTITGAFIGICFAL
jgi:hypothetical protein